MSTLADFHFIRPLWLLALFALMLIIFLLKKYRIKQSSWQSILPAHLAKVLIQESGTQKPFSLIIPTLIGMLAIIALAGPTWKKLPQPVYQVAKGSVLIMDLSYSMYATDLSPNRLTRARFKAIDLLEEINEGEMGLVAYAGAAFTISPLTEDINNIKLLLPSLSPELMPELGSNPLDALTLAADMLKNAGHIKGDIYWFTDGVETDDIQDITEWARTNQYNLNILGVGTAQGAPIKLENGELFKGNDGAIVLPKLPIKRLAGIANRSRGNYVNLSNASNDIDTLVNSSAPLNAPLADNEASKTENEQSNDNSFGDQWQDLGPYLLLPLLVLLLAYFRRGTLLSISATSLMLVGTTMLTPAPASAGVWEDLWQTKDQQAQSKFNQQRFSEAANGFTSPAWKGSAHYKAGDFEQALTEFKKDESAQGLYNQGNAYAKLQKLDEAIEAYDQALAKQPNLAEAAKNKALVEALKKQQEQQEQQEQQGDNSDNSNQNQDQEQSQENSDSQQGDQSGKNSENSQQDPSEQSPNNDEQQGEQADNNTENEDEQQSKNGEENSEESSEKDADSEASPSEQEQSPEALEEEAQQQAQAMTEGDESETPQSEEAKQLAAKLAQEKEQKNQQLLNKVTDDPYLLLREKMRREYKKRRLNNSSRGDQKKW